MTLEQVIVALCVLALCAFAYAAGLVKGYAEGCTATAASVIDQEPCGLGELPLHRATMAD
tara:strand:- start:46 stop:225 length:180 start_codon:yes stop_codon:yes gene_type:complete